MTKPSLPPKGSLFSVVWTGGKQLLVMCSNWISILGIAIFMIALGLLTAYWLWSLAGLPINRYLEGFSVLMFPALFIAGLIIVPLGIVLTHRRQLKLGMTPEDLEIKLKDLRFRGSVGILIGLTVLVVLPVISVSGYGVYHFTESTKFCGEFCHTVMQPQSVAHARSPHARVACAECHIGAGAGFFVKSKMSGLRQVYAVLANDYPTPIPPAITELRPARDTCEECHWPSKFFGTQYRKRVHYSSNEFNTRQEVDIMIKTGGGKFGTEDGEGIHQHMLAAGAVEYIAADEGLQEIDWIRYTRKDGEVSTYRKKGTAKGAPEPEGVKRLVDCMDCHNRGAHHFESPQAAMDIELESKRIDDQLPFIMRESLDALVAPYPDLASAKADIEQRLVSFYQKDYPAVWAAQQSSIKKAVKRVQAVYSEQFFPHMKEDWRTYPENIGHQLSPGCFRCHDGLHVDEKNRPINSDCTICHSFVNETDEGLDCLKFGKFQHPNSLSVHDKVLCSSCHGTGKNRACKDCHKDEDWKKERGKGKFSLPDAGVSNPRFEDAEQESRKDMLFRLVEPKDEWKKTEPLRRLKTKKTGESEGGQLR
jgi:hypothetical protein